MKHNPQRRTLAIGAAVLVGVLGVAVAIGLADTGSPGHSPPDGRLTVQTPDGAAQIQPGTLDPGSIRYEGQTDRALFFTATDGPSGYVCFVIALKDESATTGSGCDPRESVQDRGQFGALETQDGTAVAAYRSFARIDAASLNGRSVPFTDDMAIFEVPPSSEVEIAVSSAGRTFRKTLVTKTSLLASVGADRRAP